jgi:hypothetical protein
MVVGLVASLFVVAVAAARVPEGTFWLEAGKAAMSAVAVGFFSVVIGFFVKNRDARRDEDRQLMEYRRKFLLEVGDAYGRVKAARRVLRAKGAGPNGPRTLTAALLEAFNTEVEELSEAQLTFERLSREVSAQRAFTKRGRLERELATVKKYLREIIGEWEDGSPHLEPGGSADDLHSWPRLRALLLRKKDPASDFGQVSDAIDAIEKAIWADVLPRSARKEQGRRSGSGGARRQIAD